MSDLYLHHFFLKIPLYFLDISFLFFIVILFHICKTLHFYICSFFLLRHNLLKKNLLSTIIFINNSPKYIKTLRYLFRGISKYKPWIITLIIYHALIIIIANLPPLLPSSNSIISLKPFLFTIFLNNPPRGVYNCPSPFKKINK